MAVKLDLKAREGRELQRWDENGARLVAGCVPIVNGMVCLISNRKDRFKWGLPKVPTTYSSTAQIRSFDFKFPRVAGNRTSRALRARLCANCTKKQGYEG